MYLCYQSRHKHTLQPIPNATPLSLHTQLPWAALTLWGFCEAPVSWGMNEHAYAFDGAENDLTVLLLKGGRHILFRAVGRSDALSR